MKILICAEGMPYAIPTVRFGGLIARLEGSPLTVLTVIGSEDERPAAESTLVQARELLDGLTVETKVREGAAAREIVAESQEGDYHLVVIGARTTTRLTDLLLGSVARQVINHAPVSVLVVRGEQPKLERVLVCTGGREIAEPVVRMGADLTRAAGAQATLLHVISPVPSMYTGLETIEETLPELLQTDTPAARHLRWGAEILHEHGLTAELELRHGVAADEILREAHQRHYDLIVVGAPDVDGWLKSLLMGDVTHQVVEHALCPVLVVRSLANSGARRISPSSLSLPDHIGHEPHGVDSADPGVCPGAGPAGSGAPDHGY